MEYRYIFLMSIFIYCGYIIRNKGYEVNWLSNKMVCGAVLLYSLCLCINGYTNLSIGNFGKSVWLTIIAGFTGMGHRTKRFFNGREKWAKGFENQRV